MEKEENEMIILKTHQLIILFIYNPLLRTTPLTFKNGHVFHIVIEGQQCMSATFPPYNTGLH